MTSKTRRIRVYQKWQKVTKVLKTTKKNIETKSWTVQLIMKNAKCSSSCWSFWWELNLFSLKRRRVMSILVGQINDLLAGLANTIWNHVVPTLMSRWFTKAATWPGNIVIIVWTGNDVILLVRKWRLSLPENGVTFGWTENGVDVLLARWRNLGNKNCLICV